MSKVSQLCTNCNREYTAELDHLEYDDITGKYYNKLSSYCPECISDMNIELDEE